MINSTSLDYKAIAIVLGAANVIVGALLLILRSVIIKANEVTKTWFSTDGILKALEHMHDVDSYLIKSQKALGFASILLGAVLLFFFTQL